MISLKMLLFHYLVILISMEAGVSLVALVVGSSFEEWGWRSAEAAAISATAFVIFHYFRVRRIRKGQLPET
jgi:hypothetical protein